jgi:hypothetical protein
MCNILAPEKKRTLNKTNQAKNQSASSARSAQKLSSE